jgi:MtaA/CmuA family methyltransferase
MRSIDRVRGVIAGKPVDRLPAQPMAMMFAAQHAGVRYIDYTKDGRLLAEAQLKFAHDFDIDCVLMCSDPAREVIDIAGEGSVKWYESQGPAICEERAALLDKSLLKTFRIPDPLGGGRMHDRIHSIEICLRELHGDTSIVGWIEGPLALAAELRGLNHVMTDFIDDPEFVHDLMDFTAEVAIVYADAQIRAGADTIGMSDAAASMIGPCHYARFLQPWQRRVLEAIHKAHPETILRLHMCGNTGPLIPQMATLPVDIFELDFPVDLPAARTALGPNRVILGNVSTIADLLEGSPERVSAAVRRCHETCGKFHIVGAGCELSPFTPPDNLRAMVAYAQTHTPDQPGKSGPERGCKTWLIETIE